MDLAPNEFPNSVPHSVVVSVRITTYNHAAYIAQCLESVLSQETDFPFEICVGEDDSTDGTRQICIDYAQKYPSKIRLFLREEKDKIYVAGRKTGRLNGRLTRQACRGKYIALLEGDDYWVDSSKLQKQYDILETDDSLAICGTRWNVEQLDVSAGSRKYVDGEDSIRYYGFAEVLRSQIRFRTATLMYRLSAYPGPQAWAGNVLNGDKVLMLVLTRGGFRGVHLPDITATYRVHQGGIWSSASSLRQSHSYYNLWKSFEPEAPEVFKGEVREFRLRMAIALFFGHLGRFQIRQSLAYWPEMRNSWRKVTLFIPVHFWRIAKDYFRRSKALSSSQRN